MSEDVEGWRATIAERAAILEYDNGLSRAEAEAQAVREIVDTHQANRASAPGILGELVRADRLRSRPELATWLETNKLAAVRAPLWGFDHILPEGEGYRPALDAEPSHSALIVPATEGGAIIDLVAFDLKENRMLRRLGVAQLVGASEVSIARDSGEPLLVFDHTLNWLRGHTRGVVIADWRDIGSAFEGVRIIRCRAALATRLHAATRSCWPVPTIEVAVIESRHAA
jgi:hypothetical protein